MKKRWLWALVSLLVISAVFLSGCSKVEVSSPQGGQQVGIWVNGEGKVLAVPDVANLRLGIEAQAATVEEAQTDAAQAMDRVMTALKDNGVAEKDIQTLYFSINKVTKWDSDTGEEIVIGYRVTNMVTAKIREVEKAGSIVDAVARAGGDLTRVDDISFSVDDLSVYQEEARQKAMADAKAKAEQLARLAGISLGKPTYIWESIYMPSPVYYPQMAMEVPTPELAPPTPISPGELEVIATVQVTYAILD